MRFLVFILTLALPLAAQQYRGFWADAFHYGYKTQLECDRMLDDATTARANALFVEVRHRGGSYYLNSLEPPAEDSDWSSTFDALAYLIEKGHAKGMEVHAWYPVTPLWPLTRPPANPDHVWHKHGPNAPGDDMWMSVSSKGGVSSSLDPGHPEAFRYLTEVILHAARFYELDGIHLDYIRYPEDADYGWNPTAIDRFKRQENRTVAPASNDARFNAFRRTQITSLVRQIYLRAHAIRPSIKVSAALISWGNGPTSDAGFLSTDAYATVFQDWRSWMEEGILDVGIPMNYFRESSNAAFFDRWVEFEKDRQYGRALLVGMGNYLNPIQSSVSQLRRGLAPSVKGNSLWGATFYSYAVTNQEKSSGGVTEPNADFYKSIAGVFGSAATAPELPWLARPSTGHLHGWIQVEGGPMWLKDGVTVEVLAETKFGLTTRVLATDSTGFFGAVDLAPGSYFIRASRGGREIYRSASREVVAGGNPNFEAPLKAEDFTGVVPRIEQVSLEAAPAGGSLMVSGVALTPLNLGATQVLVNGQVAAVKSVTDTNFELQLPYAAAGAWNIQVRHSGMESVTFQVPYVVAAPQILGVNRREDGYLEIAMSGLGAVTPVIAAGTAPAVNGPLPRVVAPVVAMVDGVELKPDFAGLIPNFPGRYQVNVKLPVGASSGELRVKVGVDGSAVVSEGVRF